MSDPVTSFVNRHGGAATLARKLQISTQSVYGWIKREHIPAARALQMQRMNLVDSLDEVPMRKVTA